MLIFKFIDWKCWLNTCNFIRKMVLLLKWVYASKDTWPMMASDVLCFLISFSLFLILFTVYIFISYNFILKLFNNYYNFRWLFHDDIPRKSKTLNISWYFSGTKNSWEKYLLQWWCGDKLICNLSVFSNLFCYPWTDCWFNSDDLIIFCRYCWHWRGLSKLKN